MTNSELWGIYYLPWSRTSVFGNMSVSVCIQCWQFNMPQYFSLLVLPSATREAASMTKTVPSLLWSWRQLPTWVCSGSSHGALRSCCLVGLIEVIRTKVTCRLVSWPSILCCGVTCRCWSLSSPSHSSTSTRLPSTLYVSIDSATTLATNAAVTKK